MAQIRVRSCDEGPSSGLMAAGNEPRAFKVGAEDLRDSPEAVDVRVVTRPGMLEQDVCWFEVLAGLVAI